MPGLVPGIHDFHHQTEQDVDGRDKPGHDEEMKTPSTSRPLDAVAALIMLALTLSWGLNQVSIKLALPEIPPFIQAVVRSTGAFLIIALWARGRGVSLTVRDGTLAGGLI